MSNESFLIVLGEPAPALTAVHSFTPGNIELAKIGYHHDLKPKNILVDGARFILADFGLSKFKRPEQTSETTYKIGEGYYMAPACQDLHFPMQKHFIRCSIGIWSFGCILAEVFTYLMRGAAGLECFMQETRFEFEN